MSIWSGKKNKNSKANPRKKWTKWDRIDPAREKEKNMDAKDIDDFNGYLAPYVGQTTMVVNGLHCRFHMPKAVGRQYNEDGTEKIAGLPPGNPRPAFKVDEYPACPTGWMHGSGKAGSFFVPVMPEHGMWLDFNGNNVNKYHVAAVVSVQGINPLTGRKTDPIRLEQYKTKCPVHAIEFEQDRFCKTCKHKWPGQNYLSSNNGGAFWLDGFMTEEGVIRQWFFTEDECKGVAAQLIKDQRVFAIGIAFYLSKEPKPQPKWETYSGGMMMCAAGGGAASGGFTNWCPPGPYGPPGPSGASINHLYDGGSISIANDGGGLESIYTSSNVGPTGIQGPTGGPTGPTGAIGPQSPSLKYNPMGQDEDFFLATRSAEPKKSRSALRQDQVEIEKSAKKIEIGAGAKIVQRIHDDPEPLDFWRDEPEAFVYINYCDAETCKKILAAGKREEAAEGFLEGLKIAN